MNIINGKELAKQILDDVKEEIKKLPVQPGLGVVLVGDDIASQIYIKKKEQACEKVGIRFEKFLYDSSVEDEELFARIRELNKREDVNGILIQLPLPKHLDTDKIIATIDSKKDVDGFLPESKVESPTIAGVLELIKSTTAKAGQAGENLKNKTAVILANSNIFADPLKNLLEKQGCSVEILIKPKHQNLNADIIVSALGKPKFITADMVKDNAIIIDVGITRVDKKIFGDADAESLKDKNVWLTPVPGGVGPMTVTMLIKNLLILSK